MCSNDFVKFIDFPRVLKKSNIFFSPTFSRHFGGSSGSDPLTKDVIESGAVDVNEREIDGRLSWSCWAAGNGHARRTACLVLAEHACKSQMLRAFANRGPHSLEVREVQVPLLSLRRPTGSNWTDSFLHSVICDCLDCLKWVHVSFSN